MQTQNVQNNIVDIITYLKEREDKAIEEAEISGHRSPWSDKDISQTLEFTWNGKNYRQFIESFAYVSPHVLERAQIKLHEINLKYSKDDLEPKLVKAGKIYHPIMTRTLTVDTEETVHGHGRVYASKKVWGSLSDIPRYLLSDNLFEVMADGTYKPVDPQIMRFGRTLGKIKPNVPPKNDTYSREDIVEQLRQLYKADPTFMGINPSGKFPEDPTKINNPVFNNLMDELSPEQFLDKGNRTKIWKAWNSGNRWVQVRPVDKDAITLAMAENKVDTGLSGRATRLAFLKHVDEKSKSYIGYTDDLGEDFERQLLSKLLITWADPTPGEELEKDFGVKLFIDTKKAGLKPSKISINNARKKFQARVERANTILRYYEVPVLFHEINFIHMLKDGSDKIETIILEQT